MDQYPHFTTWTPRTRANAATTPEAQFTQQTFDTLKSVMYKAFARLPEAREVLCTALAEFTRLTAAGPANPKAAAQ